MSGRALASLERLARSALDEAVLGLAARRAAVAACEREIEALRAAYGGELAIGLGLADGARLVAAYAEGARQREVLLAADLARRRRDVLTAEAAVLACRAELRSLERVIERRAERAAAEAARKVQLALDEAAILRSGSFGAP